MSPSLAAEFDHLGTRLDQMIERIKALPSDVQRAPVGKSFSPIKALEHMAITEKSYVELAKKTVAAKLVNRKGKPNFLYGLTLKALSKPVEVSTPTPRMFMPSGEMSIEDSAKLWKEQRAMLLGHLKAYDDVDAAIRNPLFGYLSPRDLFVLMERHQDYHEARLPN